MTKYSQAAAFVMHELQAVGMNCPPSPPSPFDEIGHSKRRVQVRRHILQLMKEKFPGLPY